MKTMIHHLEEHFSITKSSGDLYVGLHIHQDLQRRLIFINQTVYLRRIMHFHLWLFFLCSGQHTSKPQSPVGFFPEPVPDAPFSYAVVVGSLMFAQILSRPDISFSVNTVA